MASEPLPLPRTLVFLKEGIASGCVKYAGQGEVIWDNNGSVFDPQAKIVVERSKSDDNLFNMRFAYSNRYWTLNLTDQGDFVANSKQPQEDPSLPLCTLFYIDPKPHSDYFYIRHLQTQFYVLRADSRLQFFFTTDDDVLDSLGMDILWAYKDWESLVKMPDHVAFKGDNGKYLTDVWAENHPYLQFSSNDPNDGRSGFQITHLPSGYLMVKSDHFNNFWRRSPNWIWADYSESGGRNYDTYFWPVKIDDSTIAIQNLGNQHYCKPLSMDGKTNCLNAAVGTITKDSRMVVEELVLDKKVYNVTYQMDDARVYGMKPYVAGKTTAVNDGDQEANIAVSIEYTDERSYSFARSLSITAGVTTTIEADVLGIEKGEIGFSFSISGAFEWNNTTTTSTSLTATGSVPVPAKSGGVVSYVGTQGTCDVPFHYTVESKRSTDGQIVITDEIDGIFTGVNCYDFNFQFEKTDDL